ncbi:hypothetical protein FSP39_021413 [Pinctada imbricata]|uniref:Ribonuclease 3 n=1 Tax=Pinctada imbricata TaxID=66713 RepID=A0AA88XTW6_PINIB|nr:hypothetical protein FSP39_021413 [Pinctada imbricata]
MQQSMAIQQQNLAMSQQNMAVRQTAMSMQPTNMAIQQPNMTMQTANMVMQQHNLALQQPNLNMQQQNLAFYQQQTMAIQQQQQNFALQQQSMNFLQNLQNRAMSIPQMQASGVGMWGSGVASVNYRAGNTQLTNIPVPMPPPLLPENVTSALLSGQTSLSSDGIKIPPPGTGLGILGETPNFPGTVKLGLLNQLQDNVNKSQQNYSKSGDSGESRTNKGGDKDSRGRDKGQMDRDTSRRRDDGKGYRNRDRDSYKGGRRRKGDSRDRDSRRRYSDSDSKDNSDSDRPTRRSSRSRSPLTKEDAKKQPVFTDQELNALYGNDEIELPDEIIPKWTRSSPADLYFTRDKQTGFLISTKRMRDLEEKFEHSLVMRAFRVQQSYPPYEEPKRPTKLHHHCHHHSESSCSSSESEEDDDDEEDMDEWMETLNRKKKHPYRLHEELWYNDPGEMNDGPLCKCSLKARKSGIRHNIYPGEEPLPKCEQNTANSGKLFHYHITMSPPTNFLTKTPTIILHDCHEYIFEGFSLFSHVKLENVPVCKVIRFNIDYTIHLLEEDMPENFSVRSLDLFRDYLFTELLELVDLDWRGPGTDENCTRFHLMPRFARSLPENGKELLSMNVVLKYLLDCSLPLIREDQLDSLKDFDTAEWQKYVDQIRGMVVTKPGMKPSSVRIDQLDRQVSDNDENEYPLIIHFGIRPAQLSYAGDPTYQKMWKQYVKYKHLLNSKPKVTFSDKKKLADKEKYLQELRMKSTMKREITVELSSEGFYRTGIWSDITQHAMLIPVLLGHLRFHQCLSALEETIDYKFKDRTLLQLALTHTSYKVNYGLNPDHARNSLSNCGMRQLEYGDRKIHYVHTRKRGINILINIMSRMGKKEELASEIPHNERLEFLGDAVVEFVSSVHLYYMFPWLEEGGLTTYRAAIVQNQHLAVLAKKLRLQDFMLYAHGPDLCHESDLRHAMANCFEALMGALFIDGGIELADRIFGTTLFEEEHLLQVWRELPVHPLQEDEPEGDRHWIESSIALKRLVEFEKAIGLKFDHIRLLARAFTLRSVGYNNLTLGHNQRLEFLGDTVLQLVSSEYLFRHFPDHHEGHLSLLRSSLVNNRTQAIVCDDLGMCQYVIYAETRGENLEMKTKEKADLLEAFMGSLYVDKDLQFCQAFCNVCFFPRLKDFILNQDWNDPKSQLQQCCLTLRELDGGEPDIPIYKMIESIGPTNTRRYTVAVYFRGERLATGVGHSIQQAEMSAATNALNERSELFPILAHQKRYLQRKHKAQQQQSLGFKGGRERGPKKDFSDRRSLEERGGRSLEERMVKGYQGSKHFKR